MKAKTAFVRAKRRVELYSIATIDLDLATIILPDHTELYDPFRYGSNLEGLLVLWVFLKEGGILECRGKLLNRGQYRRSWPRVSHERNLARKHVKACDESLCPCASRVSLAAGLTYLCMLAQTQARRVDWTS